MKPFQLILFFALALTSARAAWCDATAPLSPAAPEDRQWISGTWLSTDHPDTIRIDVDPAAGTFTYDTALELQDGTKCRILRHGRDLLVSVASPEAAAASVETPMREGERLFVLSFSETHYDLADGRAVYPGDSVGAIYEKTD